MSWTRPSAAIDLLLMREGRLLTQDTPDGLRRRTDTTTLDAAFLRLISTAAAA